MRCITSFLSYKLILQRTNSVDSNFYLVAGLEPYAAALLMTEDNSGRCAGIYKITGIQRKIAGTVADYLGAVENHIIGITVLHQVAVQAALNRVGGIGVEAVGGDNERPCR